MLDTLSLNNSPSLVHTAHSGCCYVCGSDKGDERTPDAPEFMTNEFRMHHFKIDNCQRQQPHDWTTCPFAHAGEKARRRDPARFKYAAIACIDMKNNGQCPRGDDCPYAHNVFEYWMHPTRYRTQVCNDGTKCKRQICFFAHRLEELRVPPRKPGFPPEWHKGRKHKNKNFSSRKPSTSPKNESGKGFSDPVVHSKSGWHEPLDQNNINNKNDNDEFLRNACLNAANNVCILDHKNTGYAMHDLISVSRHLTDTLSTPFSSILSLSGQNGQNLQYQNDDHCLALLKESQTTSQELNDCVSKLGHALNAFHPNVDWSAEQFTQSSSEYAAYAPVIPTALSTTHGMNLDVDRQFLTSLDISKPLVIEPTTIHNSSLSPPRSVRFYPEKAPFPGMGSDQESPPATQVAEFTSGLCFGQNPLSYCAPMGEGMFSHTSHENSQISDHLKNLNV